jgi:DNA repair exonuclease SbcCD ATPase subunit
MPKCNVLILDEPGSALDEDHLESFSRIIEMLKGYFDTCMIITHVGALKDIVDREISIEKKKGFAYINE